MAGAEWAVLPSIPTQAAEEEEVVVVGTGTAEGAEVEGVTPTLTLLRTEVEGAAGRGGPVATDRGSEIAIN